MLEHALQREERRGDEVGVLMVGLARFKEINETLGHRRGDLVLVEVAPAAGRAARRRGDVAARLGGDEFADRGGAGRRRRGVHRRGRARRSPRCASR